MVENIKMDLNEIGWEGMDLIHLVKDRASIKVMLTW
jgi:hypothetical protein